jgi:hypothetical protein
MPDTPNTAEPTNPGRRWFQFRLRALLIGVALADCVCRLGVKMREAKQPRSLAKTGCADDAVFEGQEVFSLNGRS